MQKKILGILLTLCMLLGLFPFTVGTAALAADETTGKVHLSSAADVLELMNDSSLWSADILLENDIDLSVYEGTLTQTPIGTGTTSAAAFKGSFDGQGHTISGVNLVTAEKTNSWGFFGCVAGATVKNLTLEGTVSTSGAYVAGFVGIVATSATIQNCTNGCSVTGANDTAGIVGLANASGTLKIENCRNTGAISGAKYVSGIVARSKNPATLTGCLNTGSVTASTPDAKGYIDLGGIGGLLYTANLTNCMNTGSITVAEAGYARAINGVGGLVGRAAPTAASTITTCYNAGIVSAANPYAILGYKQGTGTLTVSGCYYKTETGNNQTAYAATEVDTAALISGEDCKTVFADLPDTAWTYTPAGPELTAFHTHNANRAVRYDNDNHWYVCDCYGYSGDGVNIEPHDFGADNICTACGTEKTTCAHTEVITEEVTSSTCSKAGTGNRVCAACGLVLETDVELPLDPDTHDGTAEILLSGDKVAYRCSACGATVKTETRAPLTDVYTASNGMTLDVGYISDAIGTESKPFASFADALAYAAASANVNAAVTVHITGTVDLPTAYAMPDYTGAVTVTGGTMNFTGTTAAEQSFRAGGTLTFENIAFTSAKSRVGARIFAQNHKLVMGEGITMQNNDPMTINATYSADGATVDGVKMYIFGGFASGEAPAEMNTDITVRSGEYWEICGWNNGDKGTAGTAKITIGKTNDSDTLISTYLVPFSDNTNSLTADSSSDVIVDGNIEIYRVYLNSAGGNSASSTYTTNFILKGAINGTHYQYETKADYPASYRYGYDLTYSTKATSAVVNVYTDLRLDSAKANAYPFFGDGAEIAADTATGTTGHTVASYTYYDYCRDVLGGHTDLDSDNFCDECGGVMPSAVTLAVGSVTAATDKATGESTMRFITKLALADGITVKKIGTYIALISFNADGTPSAEGAKVAVREQAVTGSAPASFAVDLTGIPAGQTETPIFAWSYAVLSDGTRVTQ